MKSFLATVVEHKIIACDTYHITFTADADFQFVSGQFINVKIKNPECKSKNPFILRGYSVASSSKKLPLFDLCVKLARFNDRDTGEEKTGIGSGFLSRLEKGERVDCMGPFGHFFKKNETKKTVMLATGTGIAPMRGICEELSEKKFPTKTVLLYGVSHSKFVCYNEYFQDLAEKNENFEYQLFISRQTQEEIDMIKDFEAGQKILSGRITKGLEDFSVEEYKNTDFLICGNPAMVKQVKTVLRDEKKVEKSDIVTEQY